jgi:hypothetical protein
LGSNGARFDGSGNSRFGSLPSGILFRRLGMGLRLGSLALALSALPALGLTQRSKPPVAEGPVFGAGDRDRALHFWADASRYTAGIPGDAAKRGVYQVRLTVAGSKWFAAYRKLAKPEVAGTEMVMYTPDPGSGSAPNSPTNSATRGSLASRSGRRNRASVQGGQPLPPDANPPVTLDWDTWVNAKLAFDRYQAQQTANQGNASLGLHQAKLAADMTPDEPGPCPPELARAMGEPPSFAEVAAPTEYTVRFDDDAVTMRDHVACSPRYWAYRYETGVDYPGSSVSKLPAERLGHLARLAGLDTTSLHVLSAVSGLEGGFDGLNTYDTGYVSVGFIQFAALKEGGGSLGGLLLSYKNNDPADFDRDFRSYGIDVTPSGKLAVLDLLTGAELHGPEASAKIIEDKRLSAVFVRAGQRSDAFVAAQLAAAKAWFYAANDTVTVNLDGQTATIQVADFMRSEAGLATLTDMKVNRGHIDGLSSVVQRVADRHHAKSVTELLAYEGEIMAAMKYRHDFSRDLSLTQPGDNQALTQPGFGASLGSGAGSYNSGSSESG